MLQMLSSRGLAAPTQRSLISNRRLFFILCGYLTRGSWQPNVLFTHFLFLSFIISSGFYGCYTWVKNCHIWVNCHLFPSGLQFYVFILYKVRDISHKSISLLYIWLEWVYLVENIYIHVSYRWLRPFLFSLDAGGRAENCKEALVNNNQKSPFTSQNKLMGSLCELNWSDLVSRTSSIYLNFVSLPALSFWLASMLL